MTSRSAARALQILEYVARKAARKEQPSLSVIARDLHLPASSAHGLVSALLERGFIERSETSRYRLGLRSFDVGAAYLSSRSPLGTVRPELINISRRLDMVAHFAILDGGSVLYLDKEDPPGLGIRLASAIGARLPAQWTAVGKANLAYIDETLVARNVNLSVPNASGRVYSPEDLIAELRSVRSRGYAVDEGETVNWVRCLAAPVFEVSGKCCGSIGVSYLRGESPPTQDVARVVLHATRQVSQRLGGARRA